MKKILQKNLVKAISGNLLLRLNSKILAFVTSIFLARTLGAQEYGIYAYVLALVGLLSIPTNKGIPNMIIRYTSTYKTRQEWGLLKGLFGTSNIIVLITSLIIVGITLLGIIFLPQSSLSDKALFIGLFLLPFLALTAVRKGMLNGLNHVFLGEMLESFIIPFVFITICALTVFTIDINVLDATTAMVIRILAVVCTLLVGSIIFKIKRPKNWRILTSQYKVKSWISSAIPLSIVSGMMFINTRFDILTLGIIKSSSDVGVYQVVTSGASLIVFTLTALNAVFSPHFSKLYVNNKKEELQKMVTISTRLIFFFSLPIALIIFLFNEKILAILYGEVYMIGGTPLVILAIGQLINAAFGSVGQLLIMTGYEKFNLIGVGVAVVSNVILNILFINIWGITGAAIATSISLVVWNITLAYGVYKKLNIYPSIVGKI